MGFSCLVCRISAHEDFPVSCSPACHAPAVLRWTWKWRVCPQNVFPLLPGAHGVREEPRFVTARAGESVILGCDVSPPLDGQQPPYVVEWFRFGVSIPFFINFRFYPPHVDPEYTGKTTVGLAKIKLCSYREQTNTETLWVISFIHDGFSLKPLN